jgi:LCP family protein required for cell wall assembly
MPEAPAGDELPATEQAPVPPRRGRARKRSRRPRWARNLIRASIALLAVVIALAGAEIAYVAFRYHEVKRVNVGGLSTLPTSGPNVGVQTFLLIGSTSRCVLNNKQTTAFGSCAQGITGVNSDVVLLLRADQRTKTVSILSIPRDLVMNNVRPGQFYKIDAALADGPGQLVAAIEENFGIPINHFVELNFDSFQAVVNALGGIKMYFPYRVYDDSSGLHIRTTGCVYLNGFNALALVRARNYFYYKNGRWVEDGSGDLGRIIRVHEFLRVLATAVSKQGLGNPLTDNSLLGAVAPDLEIDSKLSLSDMIDLLRAFHGTNIATVPELTMPNIENFADYIYEGYDYGSVVLPTYPQDQQAVDKFLGLTRPPGSSVAPGKITVSVTDGSGVAGQAATAEAQLSSLGFHAVGTSSATPVGPIAETVVYYKPGDLLDAERILEDIHGIVAMAQGPTLDGAEVTVVTGSEYLVIVPHHSSGGVTTTTTAATTSTSTTTTPTGKKTKKHKKATTTTTSTTSTTSTTIPSAASTLGPPSPAVQSLPSYDPRACPGA